MTTVQGMSDGVIIIDHNGKEIQFVPIFPRLKTKIGFNDGSVIEIRWDYRDIWTITQLIRGRVAAEIYACSCSDESDLYRTTAEPDRIEYVGMNGTERIIRLNKEV